MDALKAALNFVLQYEGGFVNHPDDPGGATKYGVSLRYLSGLGEDGDLNGDGRVDIEDIRGLSVDDARELYRIRFWMPLLCDDLPEALAVAVCDTAVNLGTGRAARLLQRVAGVAEDGIIGQKDPCRGSTGRAGHAGVVPVASAFALSAHHWQESQTGELCPWLGQPGARTRKPVQGAVMLSAIVGGLAALAPWIGRAISGDDGERTAQQIADVACAVTGVQNPKEAVQRVQDDPEAQRRFVLEVQKLELEFYRAETARLDSVNQTMRAELGVGADVANGWQFALAVLKSGWRPFWGYVSAVVWGIFIVGILWLLADVVKTSGLAGVAPVVTALSQVISALMPIFMMALTVLGVAVWKRSSDKKTLGGPEQKASSAGMLEKLSLPKLTRGAK